MAVSCLAVPFQPVWTFLKRDQLPESLRLTPPGGRDTAVQISQWHGPVKVKWGMPGFISRCSPLMIFTIMRAKD